MKTRILLKRVFVVGLLKVIYVILTTVISAISARSLSTYEYGIFSFLMSVTLWASIFVVFGMDILAYREVAVFYANFDYRGIARFIVSSLSFLLLLWVIVSCIMFLVWKPLFDISYSFWLYTVILILGRSLLNFDSGVLLGLERAILAELVRSVFPFAIITVIIFLFLLFANLSLDIILIVKLVTFIGLGIFVYIVLFVQYSGRDISNFVNNWARMLKVTLFSSVAFFMTTALSHSIVFLPILSLKVFSEYENIALFDVANRFSLLIVFPLSSVNLIIAPQVAKLYRDRSYAKIQELVYKATLISSLFALVAFVVVVVYGRKIISVLWGESYEFSFVASIILASGEMVNAFSGPVALLLNMTKYEKIVLKVMVVCAILSVGLNFAFVPYLGLEGAAVSRSLTTIFWNLLLVYHVRSLLGINPTAFSKILLRR